MSYTRLLTSPAVRTWALTTMGTRLAVSTVPLASVFAAAGILGSYAIGGLLAGGYAAGEALLAPVMGRRAQRRRLRGELGVAITAEAALTAVSIGVLACAPHWWPVAVITLAGAGGLASGVPGALRSYVATMVDTTLRDKALSVDNIIGQACWLTGPTVAALSAALRPWLPLALVVVVLTLTLPVIVALPPAQDHADQSQRGEEPSSLRLARAMLLPVVASATIMAALAALDVLIPAHVAANGVHQFASGLTLAALAAASMATSAVYGARRWPSTPQRQSQVGILLMGALVLAIGLGVEYFPLSLILCALVGAAEAPALLGRNIALTEQLSADDWTVGFSLLYSAGGIGYTIGSSLAGQLLERTTVGVAFTLVGAAVAVIAIMTIVVERRPTPGKAVRTAQVGAN